MIELIMEKIYRHLVKYHAAYIWVLVLYLAFVQHYTLAINVSNSLDGVIYLIHKGELPQKGDLVAFRYRGGGPYAPGARFLKVVVGTEGSVVTAVDLGDGYKEYFVDGRSVGKAKPTSKEGMPLKHGPTGTLPEGRYFVSAPNPDSLDSRYELVGWVTKDQIIGRAWRII